MFKVSNDVNFISLKLTGNGKLRWSNNSYYDINSNNCIQSYTYHYVNTEEKLIDVTDMSLSYLHMFSAYDVILLPNCDSILCYIYELPIVATLSYTIEFHDLMITKLDLSQWTINIDIFHGMFDNCHNLIEINLSNWNVKNVKSMYNMFNNCDELKIINLTGWEINKDTDCDFMFSDCHKLETIITNCNFNFNKIQLNLCIFNNCNKLNYNFKCLSMVYEFMDTPSKNIFDINIFLLVTDFI